MAVGRGQLGRALLLVGLCLPGLEGPAVAQTTEAGGAEDSFYKYLSLYTEALSLVDRAYVDRTDAQALVKSSIEGAMDALDPFSHYVPAAEVDAYRAARSLARGRSGMLIVKERGIAYVLAVDENGPAARAGIRRGEIVESLAGEPTRQMPAWRIPQLLARPPGSRVAVELLQNGVSRTVELELGDYEIPRTSLRTVRGVPVLRLASISERTPSELDEIQLDRGAARLVIDLRSVAGGDAAAAYAVAGRFVGGDLGSLVDPGGTRQRFRGSTPSFGVGALAVLVDRSTQGAAEILATVLRQSSGAELVGEPTFGHAGRTHAVSLSSGALLEITGAFYAGADLEPLTRPLEPDLLIRSSGSTSSGRRTEQPERDEVLERAVDRLLGG